MANRVDRLKTEDFIAASITALFPNFTISRSDPFFDLYIRFFNLTALTDILKLVEASENKLSYLNFNLPLAEYDLLLKRWFKERSPGTATELSVVVVFSNNTNILRIRNTDEYEINGEFFTPKSAYTVLSLDYQPSSLISGVIEYSVVIDLLATSINFDSNIRVPGESVITPMNINSGFLRAFVDNNIIQGVAPESNQDAYQNLITTIGTDNWVNKLSFRVNLNSKFRGIITNYQVIGHSDPEMYRDVLNVAIPHKILRLTFKEKSAFTLIKKDANSVPITIIRFNRDPDIIYTLTQNSVVITEASNWQQTMSGFSIDIEITLLSESNPIGWVEDLPCQLMINTVDIINKTLLDTQDYSFYNGSYKSARAALKYDEPLSVKIHTGGFTDLYINSQIVRAQREIYMPIGANGILPIPAELKPMIKVIRVLDELGEELDVWGFNEGSVKTRFSSEDDSTIFIDPSYEARTLILECFYAPFMLSISAAALNPEVKIVQDNLLVKMKTPVFVNGLIEVGLQPGADFGVLDQMKGVVINYVNNLVDTTSLDFAKILGVLERDAGSQVVIRSVSLSATQYMPNGEEEQLFGDSELIAVTNADLGVSARTIMWFMENVEFILI